MLGASQSTPVAPHRMLAAPGITISEMRAMDYFMCKLIPPRPTFPQDMSSGERELMRQHAEYWTGLLQQKKVLLFGPVMAPEGAFGLSVLALSDEAEPAQAAEEICREDPVQRGNIGFRFEVYPMPRIVH